MKIAFATCVQLGKSCIEEIYSIGGQLDLMITLKDERAKNKSGRIYLDDLSKEHNVPLLKINHINDQEVLDAIKQYQVDWLFIIGWSQIAGEAVLNAPSLGCVGMHPTLLPKGRGRASIPWAILKGLDQTGVTMFKLDSGVDTGEIIGQGIIPLTQETTATELYDAVDNMHMQLIRDYWDDIVNNRVQLQKQDDSIATQWPGRKPADGELTSDMTVTEAERLVRAVTHPYPGAFYCNGDEKILIWKAKITDVPESGALRFTDGYLLPLEYDIVKGEV